MIIQLSSSFPWLAGALSMVMKQRFCRILLTYCSLSNWPKTPLNLFSPSQIDNLLRSAKIPIIVGGTNYYIESILWHNLVSVDGGQRKQHMKDEDKLKGLEDLIKDPSMAGKMDSMESSQLYEFLKLIDPPMANRLHPNNKRKIVRWVKLSFPPTLIEN